MIDLGVPVVPLPSCKKSPPPKGWQDFATTDIEIIKGWLVANGQPAIAFEDSNCACVATPTGVWFLDIDNMKVVSEQIEKDTGHKLQEIKTLVVRSSGEKRHLYFKQNDASRTLGNVDYDAPDGAELFSVRGNGKYVVSPFSVHPDTGEEYEITRRMDIIEAPVWLTDWLRTAKRSSRLSNENLVADQTTKIAEGGRDEFLFAQACKLRDTKLSQKAALAALLIVNSDRCSPPLAESVVKIKIKSAYTHAARDKAIREPAKTGGKDLNLNLPAVTTNSTHREYVISPAPGQKDGWFPLGAVSLVGGPSGGSKTTWMLQLLLAQALKVPFHGHDTYGRPYLMLGADRGEDAHKRTMDRMNLSLASVPFKPLPLAWDLAAAQAIADQIEATVPLPEIVFVEGCDMLVTEVNNIKAVAYFVHALQQIAQHYRVALIGSLGSPKVKEGHGYTATRDNLLGSGGWGRTVETVALLQFPKNDDTSGRRQLTVVLRNAPAEKFPLKFVNGLLEFDQDSHEEDDGAGQESKDIEWYQARARQAKDDPTKKWWTVLDLERALNLPHSTADRHVKHDHAKGHLVKKTRSKPQGPGGQAVQYRWNDSKTNPLWVEWEKQERAEQDEVF
jgi:hypothetical protein